MVCPRCGAEPAIGHSITGERIGADCLRWYEEHPEVVLRLTDAAETDVLRRYLRARR